MPEEMVNTLTQSTQAYLDLLTNANGGTASHQATHIVPVPDELEPIENQPWPVISCRLPHHQKFPQDSGASLVPTGHPGHAIRAQILAYDPQTGMAKLAVETPPPDTTSTGTLVIDFKWLIRRLLEWLQQHGADVRNPFSLPGHPPAVAEDFKGMGTLIPEKKEAIQTLLSHPAAYVWGPPGTGKTRHVLAETVTHLCGLGKKVLVTAPTNLAVENALDAILRMGGVAKDRVLRIGVPSAEFRGDWPECCEAKAFKDQLAELKKEHELLAQRQRDGRRKAELIPLIARYTQEFEHQSSASTLAGVQVEQFSDQFATASSSAEEARSQVIRIEQSIAEKRNSLAALDLPREKERLAALEREQTDLIKEKQRVMDQIAGLGWWARTFTQQEARLQSQRADTEERLKSVEKTLARQRVIFDGLQSQGRQLSEEISSLSRQLEQGKANRLLHESKAEAIQAKRLAAIQQRDASRASAQAAAESLAATRLELDQLTAMGDLPDTEAALAALTSEMAALELEIASFTQDLSDRLVLGMTLDGFIGLTMSQALSFDHLIVDEAGYAPLAKVIPLCTLRCPISLLGDHCQLPPVYEGGHDPWSASYWGTSALYLEEAFEDGVGDVPVSLLDRASEAPKFQLLRRSTLTQTFRFGPSLADLVDRHFYRIGLSSQAAADTTVEIVDCPPDNPRQAINWQNFAEVAALVHRVGRWLDWQAPEKGTLAVLSPYNNQVQLIDKTLSKEFCKHPEFWLIDILTVHRAQGREWDTVFLSASDTGRIQGNGPFLADTSKREGALVMNTAISRAKKHLRIFLDKQFWWGRQHRPSFLTELSRQ